MDIQTLTLDRAASTKGKYFEFSYAGKMLLDRHHMSEQFQEAVAFHASEHLGIPSIHENNFLETRYVMMKTPDGLSRSSLILYFNYVTILRRGGIFNEDIVLDSYRVVVLCSNYSQRGRVLCRILYSLNPRQERALIRHYQESVDDYRIHHDIRLLFHSKKDRYHLLIQGVVARYYPSLKVAPQEYEGYLAINRDITLVPTNSVYGEIFFHRLS